MKRIVYLFLCLFTITLATLVVNPIMAPDSVLVSQNPVNEEETNPLSEEKSHISWEDLNFSSSVNSIILNALDRYSNQFSQMAYLEIFNPPPEHHQYWNHVLFSD